MVDAGGEVDLRRLEGVVCGEVDREEEDTARVWRVAGAHDRRLPVELRLLVQLLLPIPCLEAGQAGGWSLAAQPNLGGLTRSSPIGPALHDDGGSLVNCQYTDSSLYYYQYMGQSIPAEICKFLHNQSAGLS